MSTESVYRENAQNLDDLFKGTGSEVFWIRGAQGKSPIGTIFEYAGPEEVWLQKVYERTISTDIETAKTFPYAVACWKAAERVHQDTPLSRLQAIANRRLSFGLTTVRFNIEAVTTVDVVAIDFYPEGNRFLYLSFPPPSELRSLWNIYCHEVGAGESFSTRFASMAPMFTLCDDPQMLRIASLAKGVFVLCAKNRRVFQFSPSGQFVGYAQAKTTQNIEDLMVCPDGKTFAVASKTAEGNGQVELFNGTEQAPFKVANIAGLACEALEMFADQCHFAATNMLRLVAVLDLQGNVKQRFSTSLPYPRVLGNGFVSWQFNRCRFSRCGQDGKEMGDVAETDYDICNHFPIPFTTNYVCAKRKQVDALGLFSLETCEWRDLPYPTHATGPYRIFSNGRIACFENRKRGYRVWFMEPGAQSDYELSWDASDHFAVVATTPHTENKQSH